LSSGTVRVLRQCVTSVVTPNLAIEGHVKGSSAFLVMPHGEREEGTSRLGWNGRTRLRKKMKPDRPYLVLQELETVDLPFDLSVALFLDASDDAGMITSDTSCETIELRDTKTLGGLQPSMQVARLTTLHYVRKPLAKFSAVAMSG
jgi:hypothetical protein